MLKVQFDRACFENRAQYSVLVNNIMSALKMQTLTLLLLSFHVVHLLLFGLLNTRFFTLFLKRFSQLSVRIRPILMRKKCDVRRSTYVVYAGNCVQYSADVQWQYWPDWSSDTSSASAWKQQFYAAAATAVV